MTQVRIDIVSQAADGEWCLHLLEDGPWSDEPAELVEQVRSIQDRVYLAVYAALEGKVGRSYPESLGARFRVQVNSPSGCPTALQKMVTSVHAVITSASEFVERTGEPTVVESIRVVTGHELGFYSANGGI